MDEIKKVIGVFSQNWCKMSKTSNRHYHMELFRYTYKIMVIDIMYYLGLFYNFRLMYKNNYS